MAITDNVASKLLDLEELTQEQYHNVYLEQVFRKGKAINRVIAEVGADDSIEVSSDGITFQVNRAFGDTTRFTNVVHDEFPTARYFDPAKIKARFKENGDTSTMDFSVVQTTASITDIQLETGGDGAIIDAAKRVVTEMGAGYNESLAKHRNLGRSARLALVNGTPKQNDTYLFSTAASTASNTAGARFPIDNGSIAMFTRGQHLDVYSSGGTLRAGNVVVSDVKYEPDKLEIGLEFTSSGADASTGNLASIADNDEIFLSGERNKGMWSLEGWFSRPASSGDAFIGGLDRNEPDNRWLICAATREGSSSTQIAPSHFDDAGNAILFATEDEITVVAQMNPLIETTLRQRLDNLTVIQQPPSGGGSDRKYQFGAEGVMFQNPVFGAVKALPDALAMPNTVRIMVANDWRMLTYGWKGMRKLPGLVGSWYRVNQSTPGSGLGKVWKQDAYGFALDYCMCPSRQVQIMNVTS